jgi:hypothetical protein
MLHCTNLAFQQLDQKDACHKFQPLQHITLSNACTPPTAQRQPQMTVAVSVGCCQAAATVAAVRFAQHPENLTRHAACKQQLLLSLGSAAPVREDCCPAAAYWG